MILKNGCQFSKSGFKMESLTASGYRASSSLNRSSQVSSKTLPENTIIRSTKSIFLTKCSNIRMKTWQKVALPRKAAIWMASSLKAPHGTTKMESWENPTRKWFMFHFQWCTSFPGTSFLLTMLKMMEACRLQEMSRTQCTILSPSRTISRSGRALFTSVQRTRQVSALASCSQLATTLTIFKWLTWLQERSHQSGSGAESRFSANLTIDDQVKFGQILQQKEKENQSPLDGEKRQHQHI